MNIQTEEKVYRLDYIKWIVVVALVAVGVYGNAHYATQLLVYRLFALLALAAAALVIVYNTAKGADLWALLQGALVELRKVVWPTRQEVNQTTLIVLAVVFVMALVLWVIDTGVGFVTSKIIG